MSDYLVSSPHVWLSCGRTIWTITKFTIIVESTHAHFCGCVEFNSTDWNKIQHFLYQAILCGLHVLVDVHVCMDHYEAYSKRRQYMCAFSGCVEFNSTIWNIIQHFLCQAILCGHHTSGRHAGRLYGPLGRSQLAQTVHT